MHKVDGGKLKNNLGEASLRRRLEWPAAVDAFKIDDVHLGPRQGTHAESRTIAADKM
jgi:hypothetical protein